MFLCRLDNMKTLFNIDFMFKMLKIVLPVFVFGFVLNFVSRRLVYNATASYPIGFYRVHSNYSESDVVWFDVPNNVERLVFGRNYIPQNAKLMKKIIAGEGASWCVSDRSLIVEGISVGKIRTEDSNKLPLPQLPEGCNTLGLDEVIVASPHPLSFDSRYFGPVKKETVHGRLEALWIW